MANKVLWDAEPSATTLIATDGALKNLAAAAGALTAEYDNGAALNRWADFELYVHDFAAAPVAGGYFSLYLFPAMDGTNYADGEDGDGADPNVSSAQLVGVFPIFAGDEDQRVPLLGIRLPPFAFKCWIVNNTSQAIPNTDGSFLKMYPYTEEVQ